ncbi:MAG: DivIVA domain-containing protein [Microbacterium sp.]|uniref:Cell wall synthesis protein Wag31 n=3 Tax=Microbacterium ginsengisoli TaxID=400772 RepID=A0A0F0LV15_9MICO|nr:DivIVA domain-containing protein [Microbacterium ginsengisoli]KJL36953.1 Cell wall synthesis protein Wag31 [Microbacterium ginsengisoli]MAL05769.1 DivIVA domain-containing protein [Microbacterium sp.]
MALTPDDVVTKQFQHVRFKEGFDPDEVDDFLDEIVVEWRKALTENDELKAKIAELEAGAAAAPDAPAPAPAVEEAPVPAPAPAAVPVEGAAATAGILELAQRLHDEHVAEGKAQREQLVAEAKAQAAVIIGDAEARGRDEIARLEKERGSLESRINELRQFERDYRSQLRSYFEGKLRDLDSTSSGSDQTPVSAIGQ